MDQEQSMQTKRSGAAVWPFVTFAVVCAVVGALLVFLKLQKERPEQFAYLTEKLCGE